MFSPEEQSREDCKRGRKALLCRGGRRSQEAVTRRSSLCAFVFFSAMRVDLSTSSSPSRSAAENPNKTQTRERKLTHRAYWATRFEDLRRATAACAIAAVPARERNTSALGCVLAPSALRASLNRKNENISCIFGPAYAVSGLRAKPRVTCGLRLCFAICK